MQKQLNDMTLQELWDLFPIELVPHNPAWKLWAEEEIKLLVGLLSRYNPSVHHIGSTAVPEILAKPIVDILVEMPVNDHKNDIIRIMETTGYILMAEDDHRLSFNKGYTPNGYAQKVFHIHFHEIGDNKEILFCDYLKCHPQIAKEYELLKESLLPRYRNDRDGYTDAKAEFINRISDIALRN